MRSKAFSPALTRRRLQRGVFRSLVDLQAAINRYLGEHNRKPKPFVWTADPDRIIETPSNRGHQVIGHTTLMSAFSSSRQMNPWLSFKH